MTIRSCGMLTKFSSLWAWPLLVLMLSACSPWRPEPSSFQLTLVYSGNLNGELEPCGCSKEGDLGGIKRTVNRVDQLRSQIPDLVLISSGGLLISDMRQHRLTSEYILKGLGALHYDAIGVQWSDLAYGQDFIRQEPLPWVVSNWGNNDFSTQRLIQRPAASLAYFQWLEPQLGPGHQMQADMLPLTADTHGLGQALAAAKARKLTTILGSTLSLADARQRLPLEHVDILIIESRHELFSEPQQLGAMLVLQPGSRGMRLGRLDFNLDADGHVSHYRHQVIPLPKAVGDAPRMAAWYETYNAAVKADYEKTVALKKQSTTESPYSGEQICQTCHQQEHEIWSKTKHAQAFYVLQDVNKAFDPNCIGCHTVGFDRPGGFIDPQVTPDLMHVQCEACHGAGRLHVESGGQQPVAHAQWPKEQICRQCHQPAHSPKFKVENYWPRIAHGRRP